MGDYLLIHAKYYYNKGCDFFLNMCVEFASGYLLLMTVQKVSIFSPMDSRMGIHNYMAVGEASNYVPPVSFTSIITFNYMDTILICVS
jgi:hypothetical protein